MVPHLAGAHIPITCCAKSLYRVPPNPRLLRVTFFLPLPLITQSYGRRLYTMAARGVNTVIPRSFSRPFQAVIRRPHYAATWRAYHTAKAEFTNLGPQGTLVSKEVTIQVGDPGEAYVLIPTEVGYALRTSSCLANSSAPPKRPDRLSLSYFHETQHFALSTPLLSAVLLLLIFQP